MGNRLEGKVAVITGASSGIGRAVIERFASEGASVVGVGRSLEKLEDMKNTIEKDGGRVAIVSADLSLEQGAIDAINAAVSNFGGLDILVNNAGVGYSYRSVRPNSMLPIDQSTSEEWDHVMAINLGSVVSCSRHAIAELRKRGGGAIVNVSSVLGLVGNPDAHAYTAAKGAIINLTRSLATAYAKENIRANVVCPGYIETPMVEEYIDFLNGEDYRYQWNPSGRMGKPEEIANGILFLASDEASYCNGSTLVIDGGMTCSP
jgi:meso-butanediol dehydrogenase/(S,S)-butanediol dehydrogenase/diacetyl reductase